MTTPLRGTPDYGAPAYTTAARNIDPATASEYAALGFNRIDASGRIIAADTFSGGLFSWALATSGAGLTPRARAQVNTAYVDPASVNLRANGLTTNDQSAIHKTIFVGQSLRMGLETVVRLQAGSAEYLMQWLYTHPNGHSHIMRLAVNSQTNNVYIINPAGANVNIFTLSAGSNNWTPLKIVGSWETGEYLRAVIGDVTINLAGNLMFSPASLGARLGMAQIGGRGIATATGAGDIDVGYAVVTKDEIP